MQIYNNDLAMHPSPVMNAMKSNSLSFSYRTLNDSTRLWLRHSTTPILALLSSSHALKRERESRNHYCAVKHENSSKYVQTHLRENGITENLLLISVKKATLCVCMTCVYACVTTHQEYKQHRQAKAITCTDLWKPSFLACSPHLSSCKLLS